MAAIVAATPPGADEEAAEAVRSEASVEEFGETLAAFTILDAVRAMRGVQRE